MIPWFVVAFVCVLWSAREDQFAKAREDLHAALKELRIERRLREQAEQREAEADEARQRVSALNWRLASHQPMGGRYYDN